MDLKIKILVVDDFSTMRGIVREALKQIGFNEIVEAKHGIAALELLKTEKVDLILSDWNMPKMTGLELLQEVKKDDNLKEIPFIMVTAEGNKDNVLSAVKEGVSNYIVKPFTPAALKEKIEKVLE